MPQTQAKRINGVMNVEKRESGAIQDVLDGNGLFPCKLYDIEHVNILRKLINVHPATVYLIYKIATYETPKEIVKFPIPIYRVKTNWHTALKRFKELNLVDFKDIELHSIEPDKVFLTPYGREVTKKWENSPLFRAFEVFDTLNFKSTEHYESVFNDNFIAYQGRKGNVLYSAARKVFRKFESDLISRTKTNSSIKIIVDSGSRFSRYEFYLEEREYNKLRNGGIIVPIVINETLITISVCPNFKDDSFTVYVFYADDFTESSFDVQRRIDLTDVILERRKSVAYLKNLSQTRVEKEDVFDITRKVLQLPTLQTPTPQPTLVPNEVIESQQPMFLGSFDSSQTTESKLKEVRKSIETAINAS